MAAGGRARPEGPRRARVDGGADPRAAWIGGGAGMDGRAPGCMGAARQPLGTVGLRQCGRFFFFFFFFFFFVSLQPEL